VFSVSWLYGQRLVAIFIFGQRLKIEKWVAWVCPVTTMAYEYIKTPEGNYVCPHCNEVKKNQSTMHMHYKANHDGALKHKCKDCDYETATKQTLENHILAKHRPVNEERVKEYKCGGCEFKSVSRGGLRSHYLLRHLSKEVSKYLGKTEGGDIQCTGCGCEFNSKPSFVYHLANCLPAEVVSRKEVSDALGV
jgi:hypothetical protein